MKRRSTVLRHEYAGPDGSAGGAASVGQELRAAREQLGWRLADCAAGLRIRLPYLEALEDGQVGALPGKVYALGFLRTYARALGLDADALSGRFKADTSHVGAKARLSFPTPAAERGLPGGAILLVALVMVVGTYAAWYRLSGEGRLPAEVVPAVPARLAPLADQAVPLSAPARSIVQASPGRAEPEDTGPTMPALSPTSAAAAIKLPPVPALAPPVVPPVVGVALDTRPADPDAPRLLLRARADAWVQVREKNGQVVLNRVLHPGDSWPVPARTGLLLTTGNAPSTDVVLDGVQVVSLGGFGSVRRDLPLDPEAVRDGRLSAIAQPAAQPIAGAPGAARPATN